MGTIQVERGNTFIWAVSLIRFPFRWFPHINIKAGVTTVPRRGDSGRWRIVSRHRTFQWLWWAVTFKWRATGLM